MNKKTILYIDMDDCIADFYKRAQTGEGTVDESLMYEEGFFENLDPVPGALVAVRKLMRHDFDIWILTQPLAESAASYQEKVRWINKWFPELNGKIIMTQNKGLHLGAFLVDDNPKKWQEKFEATPGQEFVEFPYQRIVDQKARDALSLGAWQYIANYLIGKLKEQQRDSGQDRSGLNRTE